MQTNKHLLMNTLNEQTHKKNQTTDLCTRTLESSTSRPCIKQSSVEKKRAAYRIKVTDSCEPSSYWQGLEVECDVQTIGVLNLLLRSPT